MYNINYRRILNMAIENKELSTIKKPGKIEYISKDEYYKRVQEIVKCKKDIVYFAENYYRVVHPAKGLHIIKLYDVQKDFLRFLTENNKVICCSGRQQGKCSYKDTKISIRNKKTGKIEEISIYDLFERIKTTQKNNK